MSGILILDKPAGMTSRAAAHAVARHLGYSKFGHAGTLDPGASGVLVVLLGEGTKLSNYLMANRKVYDARIQLGVATSTLDMDGEVVDHAAIPDLASIDWVSVAATFTGPILQVPPAVSAIKIAGQPAYKRVRRGEDLELPAREVIVDKLDVEPVSNDQLHIRVHCAAGTYVRSLARDIAAAIGTLGSLCDLRRLASGEHDISIANDFDALLASEVDVARAYIVSPDKALGWPVIEAGSRLALRLKDGNLPLSGEAEELYQTLPRAGDHLVLKSPERLALVEMLVDGNQARNHPKPFRYLRILLLDEKP